VRSIRLGTEGGPIGLLLSPVNTFISERRANEARKAEVRAESEGRAIEADQRFTASLGVGVPADLIPAGSTYVEAALAAELDNVAAGYRPGRRSLVEDALDNSGITFHSVQSAPEDAS
jgi:hypothetical protein